eukprot:6210510-Pleurochrysis_carterae.AAC.1
MAAAAETLSEHICRKCRKLMEQSDSAGSKEEADGSRRGGLRRRRADLERGARLVSGGARAHGAACAGTAPSRWPPWSRPAATDSTR